MTNSNAYEGLGTPFLDVLCCSLGATFLLFVIFSALEHRGARDSDSVEGLPLEGYGQVAILSSSEETNGPLLYEIKLSPTGETKAEEVDLEPINENSEEPWCEVSRDVNDASLLYVFIPKSNNVGRLKLLPEANLECSLQIRPVAGGLNPVQELFKIKRGEAADDNGDLNYAREGGFQAIGPRISEK